MMRAIHIFVALIALGLASMADARETRQRVLQYYGPEVTQVVVNKGARRMYLLHDRQVLAAYDINLGSNPVGAKRIEGDGKTPEGIYFINRFNPNSRYHLSVGISYPHPEDSAHAHAMGRSPGGNIFIHGKGPEGRALNRRDWTAGCIAVEDDEIEQIYTMLRPGVPIIINP